MTTQKTAFLFAFYGLFLIAGGLLSIGLMGMKAITALLVAGGFGFIALVAGHFMNLQKGWAFLLGAAQTLVLIPLFGWRASKSFMEMIDMLQSAQNTLMQDKALAFLIIAPMFILTLFLGAMQMAYAKGNMEELKSLKA
jgi:hypothetical protein